MFWVFFKSRIARKAQINLERTGIFTIGSILTGKEASLSSQMGVFVLFKILEFSSSQSCRFHIKFM